MFFLIEVAYIPNFLLAFVLCRLDCWKTDPIQVPAKLTKCNSLDLLGILLFILSFLFLKVFVDNAHLYRLKYVCSFANNVFVASLLIFLLTSREISLLLLDHQSRQLVFTSQLNLLYFPLLLLFFSLLDQVLEVFGALLNTNNLLPV